MSNPNIRSQRLLLGVREQQTELIKTGMAPLIAQHQHPTLIYRWQIPHQMCALTSNLGGEGGWQAYYWVDAWIACLFSLTSSMNLLKNALTTMEQYKPKILDLKIRYDEAKNDPNKQLVLLVETTMVSQNPILVEASNNAIEKLQSGATFGYVP